MAKRLSPSEKAINTFVRKHNTAIRKGSGPIGFVEYKKLGVPTFREIFRKSVLEGHSISRGRKNEQRSYELAERKIESFHYLFFETMRKPRTPEERRIKGRMISECIYNLPMKFTGLESLECANLKSSEKCDEHFYPRQWAGEFVEAHMALFGGISLEYLKRYFHVFRQVNHVTSQQNQDLKKAGQNTKEFISWQLCYHNAGIELDFVGSFHTLQEIEEIAPPRLIRYVFGKRLQ